MPGKTLNEVSVWVSRRFVLRRSAHATALPRAVGDVPRPGFSLVRSRHDEPVQQSVPR